MLCPIAKSSSFWGASEDLEFHVSNDAEILINAYSVKEGEMVNIFKNLSFRFIELYFTLYHFNYHLIISKVWLYD